MNRTPLELIVPVLMYCAMLWWVGRRFSRSQRLAVTVVTLAIVLLVVLLERAGYFRGF
jgi:hypothetical protein